MNIDQLLTKYLLGKSSKAEKNQLENWQNEATENYNALNELMELDDLLSNLKDYQHFDHKKAWEKLQSEQENVSVRKTGLLISLLSLLLLGSFLYYTCKKVTVDKAKWEAIASVETFTLNDGTIIDLGEQSNLITADQSENHRNLKLDGNAYFSVNSNTQNPFYLNTHHGKIIVTGTMFFVSTNMDVTEIYLEEGSLSYHSDGQTIDLTPGQTIVDNEHKIVKFKRYDHNANSLRLKELVFKNANLKEVFKDLEKYFGVNFIFDHADIINCQFTSKYLNPKLDLVLKELKAIFQLDYSQLENEIKINSLNCGQ